MKVIRGPICIRNGDLLYNLLGKIIPHEKLNFATVGSKQEKF